MQHLRVARRDLDGAIGGTAVSHHDFVRSERGEVLEQPADNGFLVVGGNDDRNGGGAAGHFSTSVVLVSYSPSSITRHLFPHSRTTSRCQSMLQSQSRQAGQRHSR